MKRYSSHPLLERNVLLLPIEFTFYGKSKDSLEKQKEENEKGVKKGEENKLLETDAQDFCTIEVRKDNHDIQKDICDFQFSGCFDVFQVEKQGVSSDSVGCVSIPSYQFNLEKYDYPIQKKKKRKQEIKN